MNKIFHYKNQKSVPSQKTARIDKALEDKKQTEAQQELF
jgi:hypothetical protein